MEEQLGLPATAPEVQQVEDPSMMDTVDAGNATDSAAQASVAELDNIMSSLPDSQKELITRYLSPQLAYILGSIMGTPAMDYFMQLADPNKVLLPPFNRDQVDNLMEVLGNGAGPEESGTPVTPKEATLV